jgi:formate/nitrite transporter FocA (FNT family)
VTESATPHYQTGALWGVLTLFLLVGTVAAAFVVYGFTDLLKTGRWFPDLLELAAGGMVASLAMLLVTGILYRVDRLRGVPHRRVELFE